MMKLPNCPTCAGVMLVQEGATLRCPKCRQRYSMPASSMTASDSIGGESDPSMDDTIDTPEEPLSRPGEIPHAQGEALKLPFTEAFMQVYEPVSFLGKGAMGMVYLMRQVKLDRLVAVKVVNSDALTAEVSRRLVQEAKVLASLNHANILGIFDVGEDNNLPYMVSEYVEGEPLNERLRREPPLTLAQNLRIILHVLDGLRAAHKQSIVHRDLKPSNVFLTSTGKPKIGDFGLAKSQNAPSGTAVGRILGTPGYMSPEQCRGRAVTAASDLYAVGIMLFELVGGRRPFQGPQLLDYLRQHTTEPPPRLRDIRPDVPASLDAVVAKALQKDPNDRFKSATEFKRTLQDIYRAISPSKDGSTANLSRSFGSVASGADLIPGAKLADRYELVKILGHGGMGQVWMAKDEIRQGVKVAVKLLPPELWRDPEARSNLVGEANIALQLSHPDIVRLINIEPGESPFLVMELVLGPTLSEELSRRKKLGYGPMKPYETLVVMEAISRALDYAHDRNVIHRDIKPSNLILTLQDDHIVGAKLADFGIAAELANFKTRVTGAVPAGTLSYMSPEQVTCQKLDRRADVYSLGATLFQMLTGHPPYQGDEIAGSIKSAPVPDPEGVPLAVATVVKASLAKDMNDRPGTAGELFQRLREAVGEGPGGQRTTHKSVAANKGDDSHDVSLDQDTGQSHPSAPAHHSSPTKADAHSDKSEKHDKNEDSRVPWTPGIADCVVAQESIVRTPYQMTVDHQLPPGGLDAMVAAEKQAHAPKPRKSAAGAVLFGLLAVALAAVGLCWPMIRAQLNKPPPSPTEAPPPTEAPLATPTPQPTPASVASVKAAPMPPSTGKVLIEAAEKGLSVETIEGPIGITSVPFNMPAGTANLIIRSLNFEELKLEPFQVEAGKLKTIRAALVRQKVAVKVSTLPRDAEIFVEDESKGKVSEVYVPAGKPTRITAKLPGYRDASDRITVDPNKDKEISLILTPDDVDVQIRSTPAGAQVLTPAGVSVGQTPLSFKLPPGQNLQYVLSLTGYETAPVNGSTEAGKQLVLEKTLKKIAEPSVAPPAAGGLSDEARKKRDQRVEFARNLYLAHDLEKAESALKEVLDVDPRHVETLLMLTRVYFVSEQPEQAEDMIQRAYAVDPKSPDVLDLFASVMIKRENFKKAEEIAKALVALKESDASYLATLSNVYCHWGKHKEAKEIAEKALKLRPELRVTKALRELIAKQCQ